ncbi:hypothetical protein PENTCL1PPCAC_18239, partial [Pristionchus entomophagus]
ILTLLPSLLVSKQFRFPQGYFNTKYLQPFEAIYLNLLAQSNMENGGITLDELAELSEARERITWEEHLATSTLHPPTVPRESSTLDIVKEESGHTENFDKRGTVLSRFPLTSIDDQSTILLWKTIPSKRSQLEPLLVHGPEGDGPLLLLQY